MSIYVLHEGLFDRFRNNKSNLTRRRYGEKKETKEISYSDFSRTLKDMENILNNVAKVMEKDAEKYNESYPDGVIIEYDAKHWMRQAKNMKACKPVMYCYMNYDANDINFDEDTIELVMNNMYKAAEQLGFSFGKEYAYDESEPNDRYPNILVCIWDDSDGNSITCSVQMPEKITVK